MAIFFVDILLHGIPALTGGWYYDCLTTPLANTLHIYLWLFFMIFPLFLYMFLPIYFLEYYIYPLIVAVLFTIIKLINYYLHKFFDNAGRHDDQVEKRQTLLSSCPQQCEVSKIHSTQESPPLWIDSLYGSNNSATTSSYDARKRRSYLTDYKDPTPETINELDSNDEDKEIELITHMDTLRTHESCEPAEVEILESCLSHNQVKVSLTDVILNGPTLQDTCVSDSKLYNNIHQHAVKQTSNEEKSRSFRSPRRPHQSRRIIRRVQSDLSSLCNDPTISITEQSSSNNQVTISGSSVKSKKAKSMIDNLDKIRCSEDEVALVHVSSTTNEHTQSTVQEENVPVTKDTILEVYEHEALQDTMNRQCQRNNWSPILLILKDTCTAAEGGDSNTNNITDRNEEAVMNAVTIFDNVYSPRRRMREKKLQEEEQEQEQEQEDEEDDEESANDFFPTRFHRSNSVGRRRKLNIMKMQRRAASVDQRNSTIDTYTTESPRKRKLHFTLKETCLDERNSNFQNEPFLNENASSITDQNLFEDIASPVEESSHLLIREHPRWIPVERATDEKILDCYHDHEYITAPRSIDDLEWHNETNPGIIHYFRDENGKLYSYVFGNSGYAAVSERSNSTRDRSARSIDNDTLKIDEQPTVIRAEQQQQQQPSAPASLLTLTMRLPNRQRRLPVRLIQERYVGNSSDNQNSTQLTQRQIVVTDETVHRQTSTTPDNLQPQQQQQLIKQKSMKDQVYQLTIMKRWKIDLPFDRLWLLTVFDRDRTLVECLFGICLAICVSIVSGHVLKKSIYYDLEIILYCCVVAASQYSLLKSCQPDANSPIHGYNKYTAFSRAIYFCLFCGLMLLFKDISYTNHLNIFGFNFNCSDICNILYNFLSVIVLCLPIIFLFGFLPQFTTFLLCALESVEIHLFGGTAMIHIPGALFSVGRSLVIFIILSTLGYFALELGPPKGSEHATQNILYSIYCGATVSLCYTLSRSSSNPTVLWNLFKKAIKLKTFIPKDDVYDPLPAKLELIIKQRLQSDILICFFIFVLVFASHVSTGFTSLQPHLNYVVCSLVVVIGIIFHYILPQLRKQLPWLLFSSPILKQADYDLYEPSEATKVLFWEKLFVWIVFIEKNILFPAVYLGAITDQTSKVTENFGQLLAILILTICSMKMLRNGYCNPSRQFLYLLLTSIMTYMPLTISQPSVNSSETYFLINYFVLSTVTDKLIDFTEKLNFAFVYTAPWQLSWGSAFHAIAQPFCIPHSALLLVQCAISAVMSSPLMPILGSAAFISSYSRPVKFWEKNYNTERMDNTNVQLQAQINEFHSGLDDNNLNAIFYEHLTRVLQEVLCGEIQLGRLGKVNSGDFFILTSDSLNCMIHIIEIGNGFVTFQLRGLEFKGTYCQQREVEGILEDVDKNRGFCCCEAGKIRSLLSLNAAFQQRWLAWEVICLKFVVDGYSIKENKFNDIVLGYDLRKRLISLMIKAVLFYAVRSSHIESWLQNEQIQQAMHSFKDPEHADLDPSFTHLYGDDDYKVGSKSVTRKTFASIYSSWIHLCNSKRETPLPSEQEEDLVTFCFLLSLLARRTLVSSLPSQHTVLVEIYHENFVHGFYSLFKGDFRLSSKDEWAFVDMEILKNVVARGVRMSLKLDQDSFLEMTEYIDHDKLYDDIAQNDSNLVITHETCPEWRSAILSNKPSLLALRRALVEGIDEYRVIMLDRRHLSFRIVKVSKECVRGFWASQQHELIFFRNRNPERGSIQNAKQVLRNMVNSSSDQPIGYPIYVSPLTTSYSSTSQNISNIIGGELAWDAIRSKLRTFLLRAREYCSAHCFGTGSGRNSELFERQNTFCMGPISRTGTLTINSTSVNLPVTTENERYRSTNDTVLNISRKKSLSNEQQQQQQQQNVSITTIPTVRERSSDSMTATGNAVLTVSSTATDEQIRRRSVSDFNTDKTYCKKTNQTVHLSTQSQPSSIGTSKETYAVSLNGSKPTVSFSNVSTNEKVLIIDTTAIYDSINLGRRIDVLWPQEFMRLKGGKVGWDGWEPQIGQIGNVVHRWIPFHHDQRQRSHIDKCILLVKINDKYIPIAEHGVKFLSVESTYL